MVRRLLDGANVELEEDNDGCPAYQLTSRFAHHADEGWGSKPSQVEVQLHATSDDEEPDTFAATCVFRCDFLFCFSDRAPTLINAPSHETRAGRGLPRVGYTMDLSGSAARVVFKGAAAHLHSLVRWCERGGPPLARGLAVSSVRWNSMDAPNDADSIAYATWDQLLKEKRMISLEKKSHDEGIF